MITVRVWQDLGPECSPLDVAWKSLVTDTGVTQGSTLSHRAGSVMTRLGYTLTKKFLIDRLGGGLDEARIEEVMLGEL